MNDHGGDRTDLLDVLCIAVLVLIVIGMGVNHMIDRLKRRADLLIGNIEATLDRHPTSSAIVVSACTAVAVVGLVALLA